MSELTDRAKTILTAAQDLGGPVLFNDDRKDDDELPRGSIEDALNAGEVTTDQIVSAFREGLDEYWVEDTKATWRVAYSPPVTRIIARLLNQIELEKKYIESGAQKGTAADKAEVAMIFGRMSGYAGSLAAIAEEHRNSDDISKFIAMRRGFAQDAWGILS